MKTDLESIREFWLKVKAHPDPRNTFTLIEIPIYRRLEGLDSAATPSDARRLTREEAIEFVVSDLLKRITELHDQRIGDLKRLFKMGQRACAAEYELGELKRLQNTLMAEALTKVCGEEE